MYKVTLKWEHFCIEKERNYFIWSSFSCPKGMQEERFVSNIILQWVWLAVEDLRSQMENKLSFWELSTSKETFMLLERFAKSSLCKMTRSSICPTSCGCLSSSHLSQAHGSRVGPNPAWCLERLRERDVAQCRWSRCAQLSSWLRTRGGGWGTIQLPSSTTLLWAEEVWGMRVQQAAGAGGKGMMGQTACPHHPWSHTQMVETSSC